MAVAPVVRYMLLCDDWQVDPANQSRVHIIGLMSFIRATDDPSYPLLYRELCVFLALTEGRGLGEGFITCVYEETGETVFETPRRSIDRVRTGSIGGDRHGLSNSRLLVPARRLVFRPALVRWRHRPATSAAIEVTR